MKTKFDPSWANGECPKIIIHILSEDRTEPILRCGSKSKFVRIKNSQVTNTLVDRFKGKKGIKKLKESFQEFDGALVCSKCFELESKNKHYEEI